MHEDCSPGLAQFVLSCLVLPRTEVILLVRSDLGRWEVTSSKAIRNFTGCLQHKTHSSASRSHLGYLLHITTVKSLHGGQVLSIRHLDDALHWV